MQETPDNIIDKEIPYTPRPFWEQVIHPALSKHRFAVIVCHRRFGKTVGMINQLIVEALQNTKISPQYAYVAPFRNQAKRIAWNYLKLYTHVIEGLKVNETELYVEFPPNPDQPEGAVGARIFIVGGDKPDALRGTYWDGVVFDEYAQMRPWLWTEIVSPALADRKGRAYFIGTPHGQDNFYQLWQKAQKLKRWFTFMCRVDESHVLEEEEIQRMKEDMTDIEIRQELYCDFTASAYNAVIPIDLLTESSNRLLTEKDVLPGEPVILGVDIARFGDDRTVIFMRQGFYVAEPRTYKGLDTMDVVDRIIIAISDYKPDAVFIDAGNMGAGVIDRLRQMGYTGIFEVPFGHAATNKARYENIRAEMYFKAREWMEKGGAIPNIAELKTELSVTEYKFSKHSRIVLTPKEQIKMDTGKSPDLADAFVLTFAKTIAPKITRRPGEKEKGLIFCNTEFEILKGV